MTLTASRVREVLDYDPATGDFRWCIRPKNNAPTGSLAGTSNPDGHRTIMIDGHRHYVNVLAWVHVYGVWPDGIVDHRDNNPANNRIDNLRLADRRGNRTNAKVSRNNIVGMKGVSRLPSGRFQARFNHQYLGSFDTKEAAHAAYMAAAFRTVGVFARAS